MLTILDFERNLYVRKEMIGASFDLTIGGYKAKLLFPTYEYNITCADDLLNGKDQLIQPIDGTKQKITKRNGNKIWWGHVCTFPGLSCYIKYVELLVDVDENKLSESEYTNLVEILEKWLNRFYEYCRACTNFKCDRKILNKKDCKLGILNDGYYSFDREITLEFEILTDNDSITYEQIQEAIKYACSNKEIFLKYIMLASAKESYGIDNRKTVLDGSSALELSFIEEISKICIEKSIDSECLLKKFRTLGERVKLFKILGHKIDFINIQNAINLRNRVIHNNLNESYDPSDSETLAFIKTIDAFIKHYHQAYY